MKFNHLHVHTTYSFLDGYGLPHQYIKQLKDNNQTVLGITDHGSTWAHIPFYFALKEAGLKAILGNEFYYDAIDATEKNRTRYHLTVLAKNNIGINNLYKLQTWANNEGFYYKPRIDNKRLFEHAEGLIVLSGCMGNGFLVENIMRDENLCREWLVEMQSNIDDFYVEISPIEHNSEKHDKIINLADALKIPIVSTSDTHFPAKEDYTAEDLMLTIGMKGNFFNDNRMRLPKELFLYNNEEAEKLHKKYFPDRYKEFVENSKKISEKCNVEFKQADRLQYLEQDPDNKKAEKLFDELIEKGWEKRGLDKNDPIYKERAEREIGLIKSKGFINYFLIITDLVTWAKKRMLVGSARGSVAGSLVAYLVEITEVNPIPFDLIFERFIDVTRMDLPDIDLDFPHKRRSEVIDYLIGKYGADHASLLGTIGYFKSKNAIWDVGRIFNLPYDDSKNLAKSIIDRSSGDSRASFCIEDSIEEIEEAKKIVNKHPEYKLSAKIEGQARQPGVHAAAVIVSASNLNEYGSFTKYEGRDVLCIDKHSIEKVNLLKIDVLSLKQLTIIENILKMIGKDNSWLYSLELDDKESYEILTKHNLYEGIFQFEGEALKAVCKQSYPDDFNSMSEISALARPGALHCGGTTEYLNRRAFEKNFERSTKKEADYIHPLLKEVSKETYGVIIYQEQVMLIMRDVGNMSWKDTAKVRKLISKSMGVEYFNQFFDKFKIGALENGLTEEQIDEVWTNIATFGSWAFNKSHSISYGFISYWTLYLKAHYPDEFYTCTLQQETEDRHIKYLLREWTTHFKREFVVLHPDKSEINFSIKDGIIYGGYSNIKGIGEKVAEKIISGRNSCVSIEHFKKYIGKKSFEILTQLNCIPKFRTEQLSLFEDSNPYYQKGKIKIDYENAPWADLNSIREAYGYLYEKGFSEIESIGEGSKDVKIVGRLKKINLRSMDELTVVNKIMKGRTYKDKHLSKFFNLELEDDTGVMFIGVSRYLYNTYKDDIYRAKVGGIIAVKGKKIPGFMKIKVEKLHVFKTADEIANESG